VNEDKFSIIQEFRHCWIAATLAHQERYGQCADQENLQVADANKNVFRLTASFAQELASALKAQTHDGEQEPTI
jgi:hypothetical protein